MTHYGGGGTRHFFLLNLYHFKNIGGGGGAHALPVPSIPRSLISAGKTLLKHLCQYESKSQKAGLFSIVSNCMEGCYSLSSDSQFMGYAFIIAYRSTAVLIFT